VKALLNPELQDVRIVYYTSQDPRDVTNSIYLLGAFMCLRLGATPEEAWGPFQSLKDTSNDPMCLPYRDATWVKSPYDLHVKECWAGLVRAVATGVYDLQAFDKHEVRCFRCALHLSTPSSVPWPNGPRLTCGRWGSIFIMMTLRMVTSTWWSRVNFWPSAVPGMRPTTEAPVTRLTT